MHHGPRTRSPVAALRPQVQDLNTDNIADLAVRAQALEGVIPLWYGEGDLVTPDFIRDACKQVLDDGQTFYVPDMHGTVAMRAALSDYQTGLHGRPIGLDRSTLTPGGMQAVLMAMQLIAEMGTNVVVIEPQWPNIKRAADLVGAEPRPVPLQWDEFGWSLDVAAVEARCDARTRAIFLSTPSNPGGWTASLDDLQALLDISRARGIWLVCDEVYARLYYGNAKVASSALQIAEPDDLLLCVNSFSKAWAMTGMRLGWLTHPTAIAPQVTALTQYMTSGVAAALQAAGVTALRDGEPFVVMMRERCQAGLDLAYRRLSIIPAVQLPPKPQGGMYAFCRLRGEDDAGVACRTILERARVGLAPGHLFGESSRAFIRMCICRDRAQLETALDRIAAALA